MSLTALPFIPVDIIKVVCSALLAMPVSVAVKKAGLLSGKA